MAEPTHGKATFQRLNRHDSALAAAGRKEQTGSLGVRLPVCGVENQLVGKMWVFASFFTSPICRKSLAEAGLEPARPFRDTGF